MIVKIKQNKIELVTVIRWFDQNVISCSDLDGIIKVWDLRMSYDRYTGVPKCKHSIPYAGSSSLKGYSSLVLDSTKSTAYVSCQDHTIYAFDIGRCDSVRPIKTFHGGHTNGSRFYTKVSIRSAQITHSVGFG